MLFQQDDRLPATGLKTRVDAIGFGTDLVKKRAVSIEVGAAGGADLNESEPALIGGIGFEEVLDAAKAFENTFRVVHPVNTDAEKGGFDAQLAANGGPQFTRTLNFVERDVVVVFREGDADGIGMDTSDMALAVHRKAIPFGEGFDGMIDGCEEIVAVRLDVEADQVGTEQAVHDFTLIRADPEPFGVGPG